MRLSQMRTRVILKFIKGNEDDGGGRSEALGTYATRWAAVEPLSASAQVAAQTLQSNVSYKVTLRHDPGITGSMFVELPDGAQLRSEGAPQNPGMTNVYTILMCSSYKDRSGGK